MVSLLKVFPQKEQFQIRNNKCSQKFIHIKLNKSSEFRISIQLDAISQCFHQVALQISIEILTLTSLSHTRKVILTPILTIHQNSTTEFQDQVSHSIDSSTTQHIRVRRSATIVSSKLAVE